MEQAIKAYRQITVTEEFRELERTRREAEINRASALGHARREGIKQGIKRGIKQEHQKWQGVVTELTAEIEKLRALLDKNSETVSTGDTGYEYESGRDTRAPG